jgi:outer membrane biosynthesis protein TonB
MTLTGKRIALSVVAALGFTGLATVSANADTYTVAQGDTVSAIATKYDTSIDTIKNDNKLDNVDLIFTGDKLEVNVKHKAVAVQAPSKEVKSEQPVQAQPVKQEATPVATTVKEVKQEVAPAPKQEVKQTPAQAPVQSNSAKAQIAMIESTNNYNAANPSGAYGKYQLMPFNLKYGTSPAGQERAADEYVASRYGSWDNALAWHHSHGWY